MASIGSSALNERNRSIESQHIPWKFDAGDLLRFKLELALAIVEESPGLDTLCHAFYAAHRAQRSEMPAPLEGLAWQDSINHQYSASTGS
jgi:hypothetical protein